MRKCSKCGKTSKEGQYLEVADKIECFNCIKKNKGSLKMHFSKLKPKKISCPYCEATYDYKLRECPKCKGWNPIYDFHFEEFFVNTLIGQLVILIPVFIILAIIDTNFLNIGILLLAAIAIIVLLDAIFFSIMFYLGRWIRYKISRKS